MKVEDCVIFWNVSTGERHAKSVKNLLAIASCKDLCLLAVKVEENSTQVSLMYAACDCHVTGMCSAVHFAAVQFPRDTSGLTPY